MSQHTFSTTFGNRPVTVLMGWDRPLRGFFMTIEYADDPEDEEYAYCNLDDPKLIASGGLPPDTEHFKTVLETMNVKLPQRMLDEIEADGKNNTGNRYVSYDAHGNIL